MKKLFLILITLSISILSTSIFAASNNSLPTPHNSLQTLDKIVAIVQNDVITQNELNTAIARTKKELAKRNTTMPTNDQIYHGVLQQLIYQKLQLQLAKRVGITVTDAQLKLALSHIAKQNHTNQAGLEAKIRAQGLNFTQFKKDLRNQLVINEVQRQAVNDQINVSDADVQNFLAKYQSQPGYAATYHLIDMVFDHKAQAAAALKKLKAGANYNAVAPNNNNDLGWRSLAQLPEIFTNQVTKLKTNGVAGPIQASNGYHVIQLLGTQKSQHQAPSATEVRSMLMQQKFQKAVIKWLHGLRKSAYIKIMAS